MKRFDVIKLFLCAFSILAVSANTGHTNSKNDEVIKTEELIGKDGLSPVMYLPNANEASSPITNSVSQTENYAPYYFKNLTNNYGYNKYNSCGYIATAMIMSFWDTYWDDNVVAENYERHADLPVNHTVLSVESPGGEREPANLYTMDDEDLYHQNMHNYSDEYLHFLMINIGDDLYGTEVGDYTMYWNNYLSLWREYLINYRGYSESELEFTNTSTNVRETAIQLIKQGIPVKLSTTVYNSYGKAIGGHAVVAYDYNESTDEIYCHFGWESNATHVTIEQMNCRGYNHITAVKFLNAHSHSDNFDFRRNGEVIHHCPCELFVPYDIQEQNYYVDVMPTFKWNCLCNEKWFKDKDAYLRFEILDHNMQALYTSSRLYGKSFTLNASAATALMSADDTPTNSNYIRITMRSNMDSSLNGMYYYFRTVYKPSTFLNVNNKYLSITGLSKNGNKWTVKIKNKTICILDVEYNSKMCNFDDAKNWTGLSDKKHINISPLGTTSVTISENWFATSITMSHVYQGKRYITYANNLNSNGSFTSYTNVK